MRQLLKTCCGAALLAAMTQGGFAQTLSFPSWQAGDEVFRPWWDSVIEEFESRNPSVTVDLTSIPYSQYIDQLTVRFAAGNPPDIVHLPSRNVAVFAQSGWLAPIDERLAETDIEENWTPLQSGMDWNGQTYGVLLMGYGTVMIYNQDLLDGHDLEVPTTTDELISVVETITDSEAGIFGFGGTTTEHPDVATEMIRWVVGAGSSFVTEDGYNFTSPDVIEVMNDYRAVYENAPLGVATTQTNQLFMDGRIAILMEGPFTWPAFKGPEGDQMPQARMGQVPFENIPGSMSNSLHIAAASDPEIQDLVWEFIKVAAEPEFQRSYTELTFSPAARMSAGADLDDPVLETINAAAAEAVDIFPTNQTLRENYAEYTDLLVEAGIRLQSTDDPTEEVMADLQAELESRIPLSL